MSILTRYINIPIAIGEIKSVSINKPISDETFIFFLIRPQRLNVIATVRPIHGNSFNLIKKEINDILESVYEKDYVKISEGSNVGGNLKKHLKALDKKMKEAASNLEFEEAAKIRDEIRKLESTELEITLNPKIRQYDVKNKLYPKGRSTMGMPGTKVTKKRDKKWKHKG